MKPEKGGGDGGEEEKPADVSRLNMRIGKIVEVRKGHWYLNKFVRTKMRLNAGTKIGLLVTVRLPAGLLQDVSRLFAY